MLDGFGTVVNALGERCKPYLKQIAGTIKWRLNNKAASVRMQAADLIGRIAVVMKACGEEQLMGHLGVVLYEYLGEEYPDVLGSILGALRAIVNVIGMTKMTPPIRDLLPRLTPILRNRHEKVQENCIDLVSFKYCLLLVSLFTPNVLLMQYFSLAYTFLHSDLLTFLLFAVSYLCHRRLDALLTAAQNSSLPRSGCASASNSLSSSRPTRRPSAARPSVRSATSPKPSVLRMSCTHYSTTSRSRIGRCVCAPLLPWPS